MPLLGLIASPVQAASPRAIAGPGSDLSAAVAPDAQLRTVADDRVLGARVVRFRQTVAGLPVLGAEAVLTESRGEAGDLLVDSTVAIAAAPAPATLTAVEALRRARAAAPGSGRLYGRPRATLAILPMRGRAVAVWRVLLELRGPAASLEVLVDARTGAVLRRRDLLRRAQGAARVFDTNPVAANGSRGSLSDSSPDSAFTALYDSAVLPRLNDTDTCLAGQWVQARLPDGPDSGTAFDDVCATSRDFTGFDRSDPQFEAVMAYFHIDRAQDYVTGTLGIAGANDHRQQVLANGVPEDNSFYSPSAGVIVFGTGFVDDAEDGEVLVHEYGHALQDAQVPGFGASAEGGAMGEGFSDYLAAGQSESFARRDPPDLRACFAEWDSLGSGDQGDPPCLRRLDADPTAAQVGPGTACNAEIHCAGEAWSAALWDIRSQIGAVTADRLVIRSHFSLTADSAFQEGSAALLAADQSLYGGVHQSFLRELLAARGLLDPERLDDEPGNATLVGVPATVPGSLATGSDEHDVLAVDLGAGQGLVLRLRGAAGDFNLRLFRPGSERVTDGSGIVAASERPGSNEDVAYTAVQTGRHFIDIAAVAGGGTYALTALPDRDGDALADGEDNCAQQANPAQTDRDGDRLGDDCDPFPADRENDRDRDGRAANRDNCPLRRNPAQADWDRDGRGDRCDRSARVALRVRRVRGGVLTIRATLRPGLLGPRALIVAVDRRACARCRFQAVARRRGGRPRGSGRVDVRLRLPRGATYRFRATLRDRRFRPARARPRVLQVR